MGKNNVPQTADEIIRELQQRVKQLEAASQTRVAMDTITGGTLTVQDAAGTAYLKIGKVNPNLTDGSTQYGLLLYRQSGDELVGGLAIALADPSANVNDPPIQTVRMYDINGNLVYNDDAISGTGLGRPYLSFPMGRSDYANWPSTTSATMADMFFGTPPAQQPKVTVEGLYNAPSGTNAQIQLISGTTVLGGPVTVNGSTTALIPWTIGPVAFPAAVGASYLAPTDLRVQACRTAGTGTVQVAVGASYGQQS